MKTVFLLIVLTQNGAGDINASFVNTETLEQCQQKALMLDGVFSASNIPVIESQCIQSKLSFSEFGHASASSKIQNFYHINFDNEVVQITNVLDWSKCMTLVKRGETSKRNYCSSSIQSLKN